MQNISFVDDAGMQKNITKLKHPIYPLILLIPPPRLKIRKDKFILDTYNYLGTYSTEYCWKRWKPLTRLGSLQYTLIG